ncbi:MAG TPA: IS66 family transposase [Acidimicrobiales bacterium]|nr:IS66 family transposase [Acidimicrobiales bacterium]
MILRELPGFSGLIRRAARLNDMALSLDQEVVHLREQVAQLLALVGELRGTIEQQQSHIAKLGKMTFGRTSERIEGPTLFDALPAEPPPIPAASDTPLSPREPASKRQGHGRKSNSANLPRRREEWDLSDAEKGCPCCAAVRVRIGETIRERLDYTPSSISVREIAQPTYACRICEHAARDPQFIKPIVPVEPVPKSGVGAGLLAQVIVSKSVDHLPLYRQESLFARQGWFVSRTRLCDLIRDCAILLDPVYRAMIARMKQSFAIRVDDSPVTLLNPRRTAYAWLYLGDAANPYTLFDFTPGRDDDYPAAFLQGYSGFVHADGYTGYTAVHGSGARHLGCWAPVRRKFVEAQANDPAKATEALADIRTLSAVEKEIVEKNPIGDTAVSLRQTRAGPIPKPFGEWIEAEHRTALPKSPFGQAVAYARNLGPTLGRYLADARFTLGRVERWRGSLGQAPLLPALSSAGASLA